MARPLAFMSTKAAAGKFIRKETIWALSEIILNRELTCEFAILVLLDFSEMLKYVDLPGSAPKSVLAHR